MEDRLSERFVRLCEIASPTGDERAVADAVTAELREHGIEVREDDAAGPARAGAGNLVARVPGSGDRWLMLCAHLDTVPHQGPIRVVEQDGLLRSAGETILGADNKAAVAVLIELAARQAGSPGPVGLELVFTVAEEDGLRGAKELDLGSLRAEVGFVIDHASPIGEILVAAPTYKKLAATFRGQEAHAGINPEDGNSAVAAAAAAITGMELGRLDDETTANVGLIQGGTASNVVPGSCRIEGEARSIAGEKAAASVGSMVDACTWAAGEHDCDVDVEVTEVFRSYRVGADAAPVRLALSALRRAGHQPELVATGGGSDANALRAAGFDCVLLANGTEANHTPQERVSRETLRQMLAVCEQLAAAAAESHAEAA
jgi:tripeptide aminopeptidase